MKAPSCIVPDKLRTRKVLVAVLVAIAAVVAFLIMTGTAYAAEDSSVKSILQHLQKKEVDSVSGIMVFARYLGWALFKFFASVCDGVFNGLSSIINLMDFAESSQVKALVKAYRPILLALLIVAFVFLGFFLMSKRASSNQLSIVQNIVIIVIVVLALPTITSFFTDFTKGEAVAIIKNNAATKASLKVKSGAYLANRQNLGEGSKGITTSLVAQNMVDLKVVDDNISGNKIKHWTNQNGFVDAALIKNGNWKTLSMDTVMDFEENDYKNPDVWKNRLEGGELVEMDGETWIGFDEYYYRYQIKSWFHLFITVLIMIVVLFFACVKCGRIVIEVAQAQIYMPFIAVTDLAGGQRMKECIKGFVGLFAALLLCVALLGIYFVGYGWIYSRDLNSWVALLMHLALAWAVIDGPNVLEKILGVDVGLKSGWSMVIGARAIGGMAAGAGRMVGGAAKTAGRNAGKAAGKGGEVIFGKKTPNTTKPQPPQDGKRHGGLAGMAKGEGFSGTKDPNAKNTDGKQGLFRSTGGPADKSGQNKSTAAQKQSDLRKVTPPAHPAGKAEKGMKGDRGPAGKDGLQGLRGSTGQKGLQGDRGLEGQKGTSPQPQQPRDVRPGSGGSGVRKSPPIKKK